MSSSRGRPRKETKLIEINDIRCEYITTKEDKYENEVSYIKIVDSGYKQKLKPILDQSCDECKLPLWKTDEGLYLLKVKRKFMPKNEFEQNELFNGTLVFKQYCFENDENKLLQGYYCQVQTHDIEIEN